MLDKVAKGEFAEMARRCVGPFRASFPDFRMKIVDLVADCERVAAHFRCSRTHLGEWIAHPPTGSAPSGTAGSPACSRITATIATASRGVPLAQASTEATVSSRASG